MRVGVHTARLLESTRGLDPLYTLDMQLLEISASIFGTLIRSEDGVLVPHLAERWDVDPGGRRYRLALRRDVRFTDGSPLTAGDVKRHLERLLDPRSRSPDHYVLNQVEGATEFGQGDAPDVSGIAALDDHLLEVRTNEPTAFFLNTFCLPATAIAKVLPGGQLIGTGPYQLASQSSERLTLIRNPSYFRGELPLTDRLEFHLLNDRGHALALLVEGELDLVSKLNAEHVRQPGLQSHQVVSGNTPSTYFLGFSLKERPFDDVRVRRAIRAGLDPVALVAKAHPGARLATTVTPPSLLALEGLTPPRPDLALARRLLAEAGLNRLSVTLYFPLDGDRDTSVEDRTLFGPLLEAGLLELTHVGLEPTEFWSRQRRGHVPIFRAGWFADYPDPDNFLHFLLHSRTQTVFGFGYKNDEVDRLTEEARVNIDPGLRAQLYRRVERLVSNDCVLVPLFHDRVFAAISSAVQGMRLHLTPPVVRFEELWLERE